MHTKTQYFAVAVAAVCLLAFATPAHASGLRGADDDLSLSRHEFDDVESSPHRLLATPPWVRNPEAWAKEVAAAGPVPDGLGISRNRWTGRLGAIRRFKAKLQKLRNKGMALNGPSARDTFATAIATGKFKGLVRFIKSDYASLKATGLMSSQEIRQEMLRRFPNLKAWKAFTK